MGPAPVIPPGAAAAPQGAAPAGAPVAPTPGSAPEASTAAQPLANVLPETGTIEAITPQQATTLRALVERLDELDYFEVLSLAQAAGASDIKRAFHRQSRTFHPDRFFHLPDGEVKGDLNAVYKRVTEAYYVLRDDAKRRKYLADVTGPERKAKLRFTEASEVEQKAEAKKAVEEEFGTHPKARPLFKQALADLQAQNWSAAERNLKTAIMYEPSNAKFKEKLAETQKQLEEQRRASGSGYKIK